jgi:hypothetical protein
MKCLYAIPAESAREAHALCETCSAALEALSSNTVALADDLRAFSEAIGAAVLKLDDEDWVASQQWLEARGEGVLAGEIFWPNDAARRAQSALAGRVTRRRRRRHLRAGWSPKSGVTEQWSCSPPD